MINYDRVLLLMPIFREDLKNRGFASRRDYWTNGHHNLSLLLEWLFLQWDSILPRRNLNGRARHTPSYLLGALRFQELGKVLHNLSLGFPMSCRGNVCPEPWRIRHFCRNCPIVGVLFKFSLLWSLVGFAASLTLALSRGCLEPSHASSDSG